MFDAKFPLEISSDGNIVFDKTDSEATLSLVKAICYTFAGEHPTEPRLGISDSIFQSVTPSELISSVELSLGEYVDPPFEVFANIGEGKVTITVLYQGQETEIVLKFPT